MPWDEPEPPVYPFWKGMLITTLTIVLTGVACYFVAGAL
jgi:hypothetical protein